MRKFALIRNNMVIDIQDLDDSMYMDLAPLYQLIIDIEDSYPRPNIGDIFVNNHFEVVQVEELPIETRLFYQCKAQREFAQKLINPITDKIGARNLLLISQGAPSSLVTTVVSQLTTLKMLLEGGALKTAISVINVVSPAFPTHDDIFQEIKNEIINFLNEHNY